ncbi:MAG: hypothetical protein AAF205_08740 [Pseudomonadota bacterium]
MMEGLFASGHAADLVLAVLVVEAIWLIRRGRDWRDVAGIVLPAALMMLALRAALTDMAWPYVSLPLAAAFPVHLYDLYRRNRTR